MKKSQVLAALALAFALGLGVVAPVANTYATITANTATTEQINAVLEQITDAQSDINYLEGFTDYSTLYEALEGDNGIVAKLNKGEAAVLKAVNSALANPQATNVYINEVTKTISRSGFSKLALEGKDAKLQSITPFTGKYATLTDAINAINSMIATVDANINILQKNYKYEEGNLVDEALHQYDAIICDLKTERNAGSILAFIEQTDAPAEGSNKPAGLGVTINAINAIGTIANLAKNIENIDENVYEEMVKSTEWTAPTAANITAVQKAADYKLIAKTAQALPKYKLAGAIIAAQENADKVTGTSAVVDYAVAQGYANALTNAVKAYEDGKAPSTPEQPDTTTTITTPDNTVSVKGELQDGLVVKASEAEDKDGLFKKAFGDKKFFVYNIEVLDKDGNNVTTFDKNVTVTVKVPETIDGAKAGIYYVNDEGKAEKIASTYNAEAKTLTFTTNHFSFYAIVEDGGVNVGNNGVIAAADGTASSTVAIVAGIATALTAAGAGVVAYRNARRAGKEA